jgi:hypothetical protein
MRSSRGCGSASCLLPLRRALAQIDDAIVIDDTPAQPGP